MITSQQAAYYQAFGFLVLRRAFGPDRIEAIGRTFDRLLDSERGGRPFPGESRQSLYGIAEQEPLLTALVEDDRIYETVESLLGPGFIWLCSEGNLYVGDTDWHSDRDWPDYPPVKVSFYLDPLAPATGALRVLPGSHRWPFHEALARNAKLAVTGPDVASLTMTTAPGDVVFMDMNLWHASFGGHAGRRHLAVNFLAEPRTADHQAKLEKFHQDILRMIEHRQYSQPGRVFRDAFLRSDRPRIARLVAPWVELGLA